MKLFQYAFGFQPHYVVAKDYADAEARIKEEEGWTATPEGIECLGPYVLISAAVLKAEREERS